jgi:hypothetical protein
MRRAYVPPRFEPGIAEYKYRASHLAPTYSAVDKVLEIAIT